MRRHMMAFFNADNVALIVGQLAQEVRTTLAAISAADGDAADHAARAAPPPPPAAAASVATIARPNLPGAPLRRTHVRRCCMVGYASLQMHVESDNFNRINRGLCPRCVHSPWIRDCDTADELYFLTAALPRLPRVRWCAPGDELG